MLLTIRAALALLSSVNYAYLAAAANQIPLVPPEQQGSDSYTFKWPIRRVAIIGAGPGGLINFREFTRAGYDVHLFERDDVPGGNWHYTEETADDAPIPSVDISVGDYVPSLPPKGAKLPYEKAYHGQESADLLRRHRGPKPIWATLHSNAPAPIQQITELPWPKGTAWELPHAKVGRYVRAFASYHGVNSNDGNPRVSYNTRVELVEKRFDQNGNEAGWTLTLKKVVRTGKTSSKAIWTAENFDAVVVATGRYNAPNVPNIAGLKAWADKFPGRISHSRTYRHPEPFANKTVLVVGAATSGGEISRELVPHTTKIYQSIRPDNVTKAHFRLDFFLRRLPANVTVVPEIKRFHPPGSSIDVSRVELANGTIITGIDSVLFATGYRYTFPFLPQYHNSSVKFQENRAGNSPQPIVTDGTHLRSLYLDIFYIEEPTIGFVDMNVGMQSFTYAEYIGVALTKVWAGKAKIPSTPELWRIQEKHVEELGGYGSYFQFLGTERTEKYIRFFLGWLNEAAVKHGGRQIDGLHPGNVQIGSLWSRARFGSDIYQGVPNENQTTLTVREVTGDGQIGGLRAELTDEILNDLAYDDYW
ncbi:Flavin-containing monooxygenase ustF2 [Hypsizygus marmoreus]|uniref:Flavin-containing monooxygenase ustF2 n=1 Tax=Hypsizygus marmoreus TaxID=39966 RepID=A0A369KCA0_HYPMA|nr:Flavin-containing monooxygenase ustF2 [Hypsizygus marmoreus]